MANKYLELLNQTAPSDEFDQAKYAASQRQPDEYAKVLDAAKKLQVTPAIVEPVKDEAFKQVSVIDENNRYANILKKYPKTAKFLSNPDSASVAKDDLDTLQKMEDNVDDHSFAANLLSSAGSGVMNLVSGAAKFPAMIPPLAARLMDIKNPYEREQAQAFISNPVTRTLDAGAKYLAPQEMSADILDEAKNGNLKKAGRAAAYQIASNIPQLAATVINPAFGLGFLGVSSAGNKNAQNVESGVPLAPAAINALATSGVETAIESATGIGSIGFKQAIKNTVAHVGESTAKEIFKNGLKHVMKTAGEEGLEEVVTSMAQDFIDYGMDVNPDALKGMIQRAANAGIVGAGSGGFTTGAAQSVEAGRYQIAKAQMPEMVKMQAMQQKAQAVTDYVKSYIEDRKESKLYKRSPEKYAEAHAEHVKDTPLAEVSVPVEVYEEAVFNQDKTKSPAEVAASLGILEKWEKAKQSGSDIALTPMDMSKLSDEVITAMSKDFKSLNQPLSLNEIKEQSKQVEKEVQEQANNDAVKAEVVRERITKDVTQQLVDTGLYNPQDARTNAQAVSSFFNALSVQAGGDAAALYKEFAPKIVKSVLSGPQKQGFVSKVKGMIGGTYQPAGRVISLTQAKDFASFVHESGHFFLDVMSQVQASENASKQLKDDFKIIQEYVGSDGQLTEDQHEKFTEAFVNYLQTGKAPSKGLKKAFTTFRLWLTDVFKGIRTSPELNPAIRNVFDRMLATQEEMDELNTNLNDDIYLPEMSESQQAAIAEAKEAVEDQLHKAAIDKINKELSKEFKEVRDLIEKEKTQEADRMMTFKVQEDIKDPNLIGKLDSTEIAKFGSEIFDNFPKSLMKKGGVQFGELASIYGYNSTYDMLKDIVDHPDKQQYIWEETNNEMSRSYQDLYPVFDLSEDVVKAVHGVEREKVLRMQMDFLMKKASGAVKGIAKDLIRRSPAKKVVKAQADKIISETKVGEIKPYLYRRAEVKYSKLAGQLFAKGDFEGAYEVKRKEYLNFELYNSAVEAQAQIKANGNYSKFFDKDADIAKTRDLNYVNGARAILSLYGYGNNKLSLSEILNPLKSYDPAAYSGLSDMISDTVLTAQDVENVPYAQYQAMDETVKALWSLGKSAKEKTVGDRKLSQQEVIETSGKEIQALIPESGPPQATRSQTKWEAAKGLLLASEASFRRVESWAYGIGQQTMDAIFRPVSEASTEYRKQNKVKLQELRDIVKANAEFFQGNPVTAVGLNADGTDHIFKKSELMMALLHTGNESNEKKLLVGKTWGSLNEDGSLDNSKWRTFLQEKMRDGTITQKDMQTARSIWALMESVKPDAQKAHKSMYGYYFSEITSQKIQTPWGEIEGGYIPAKLDVEGTKDLNLRKQFAEFEEDNNSYQFPTTGRGFTKSRKEQFHGPLSLDMNMLGSHLSQVLRFTHLEPVIKETAMLLKNPEYAGILKAQDANAIPDMLMPWLARSATQKVIVPSTDSKGRLVDKAASYIRNAAAIQIMFGNIVNTLQQPTGLIVAAAKVSPKYLLSAMADYLSRKGQTAEISELSDFMKQAYEGSSFETQQELEKIISNSGTFENAVNFTKQHTYVLQGITQNFVNTIVWKAAFNEHMANNPMSSEADAVAHADSMVRTTQGTQNAEDVSDFETGTATSRLFKQFIGYFNMLYNLNKSEFQSISRDMLPEKKQRLFYAYMTAFALPAFLSALISKSLSANGLDDDDDGYLDDILMSFFGSQIQQAVAVTPIPFASQAGAAVIGQFTKQRYDDRLNMSPALSSVDNVLKYMKESGDYVVNDDGDKGVQTAMGALETLGFFAQIPVKPVTQRIKYLNKEDEPTVKGLIIGK